MYSCRSLSVLLLLLFAGPVTAHAADRPAVMDVATVLARAEEGFRGAQLDAHYIYKLGLGVAADATLAQTWWDKAIAGWQPPADGPSAEEKFRLYLAVAEQGSGIAANQLAIVYREGRGTAADATQAAVWFERAARAGFASASGSYETLTGQPLPMGPIPQTPLPLEPLRALAEAGDARACYDLGLIYYNGQGVPKDTAVGQQWLNRAASAGWKWPEDPALKGDSPEANHGRWEYHAAQGSIYALHILAWNHYNGRNVAENKAEAANWFKRAADAGHLYSADKYAQMLRAGEAGVPYDPAAAVTYFERSAAGHYGSGYFGLAYAYATGSGATRDDRRARDFYERSLVVHPQLHASMINLGNLLKTGAGGPVDFPRARRLYEACLDVKGQTSGFAAINLGDMHRDGQLGSVDTVKARDACRRD